MPDPTVQNVLDAARSYLGDTDVSGGQIYTNTMLLESAFPRAYRTLWRALSNFGAPRVKREVFHVVPANTDYLAPSTASISDFGEPSYIGERGNLSTTSITGASGTTTVSITAASHGRSTGQMVTVNGIVGFYGTEGMWGVTVTNSNVLVLNGAVGSGTYSSGGTLVYSGEEFSEVLPTDRFEWLGSAATADMFRNYQWREGAFHFPPCSSARQLRIEYWASGTAPTSTSAAIGIDDSLDFLAVYTAALGIGSRGGTQRRAELLEEALGPSRSPDRPGGLLFDFINRRTLQMQMLPPDLRRRKPFREQRSQFPPIF